MVLGSQKKIERWFSWQNLCMYNLLQKTLGSSVNFLGNSKDLKWLLESWIETYCWHMLEEICNNFLKGMYAIQILLFFLKEEFFLS